MTRFNASFLLLGVLALSKAAFLVQAQETSQATVSTGTCVINTPQGTTDTIRVGHDLEITWAGCKGHGKRIEVRYGVSTNLEKDDDYACEVKDLEKKKSCVWTPSKAGTFSLSVVDDSGKETFTAQFTVEKRHGKRALLATRAYKGEKAKGGKGKGMGGKGKGMGSKGKGKGGKGKAENGHGKTEGMEKNPEVNAMKGHPKIEKQPENHGYPAGMPRRRSLRRA